MISINIGSILKYFSENNRWAICLVFIMLIVGSVIYNLQRNSIEELKTKHLTEVKFKNALIDTVGYYKNVYGEEVAVKLTLQTTVKNLLLLNDNLSDSQQDLLKRIKNVEKKNSIIAAALIDAESIIDSLLADGYVEINVADSSFKFTDSTEFLIYDILIGKAFPVIPDVDPTLMFNKLSMPNKQFVNFYWKDNKKEGYPISFSTSNSSPYFKTNDINSYVIPEINKKEINPTGWEKVGIWFKKNNQLVKFAASGVVIGATGTYVIMNTQ